MPHGLDGDQGSTTNAALPEPGDQADGADEEPYLRSADGDRCQLQQAAAAQGGYFAELMTTNKEVHESIRPLLKLSRDMISRSQKLDYALVSSLQRDPVLKERLRRLRTVPGVGPITALTWALEIGDYTRFSSIKQAISYCGFVRRREEFGREGDADADFQAEEQAYPASTDRGCQARAQ